METHAPKLETPATLLKSNTLPLLVQQRTGGRLLLHKSCIIPYVICEPLEDSKESDEYFLIPLSNRGYYGAVSVYDEPSPPYQCLAQILDSELTPDCVDILVDNVTPVRHYDKDTNKCISKVLLPGDTIQVSKAKSCPLLANSSKSSLCCFRSTPTETADNTVCVRDNSRHIHIERHLESRFYTINEGGVHTMHAGTVSSLQDITQHQSLPKVVCTVAVKQTPRDDLPLPRMFRLLKIISDTVLLAYRLSDYNHPQPDDVIELSSYSQEMLAIAESSRVNMDDIRHHHVNMSIKRALPGKTLSHKDFHDIVRKSQILPPKLPERPPTLRLKQSTRPDIRHSTSYGAASSEREPADVDRRSFPPTVQYTQVETTERTTLRRLDFSGITAPDFKSSHTVKLPTRNTSNTSILKKFSSVSVRRDSKHPSMKTILNNFHTKDDENNNKRRKSKKSLRGLEIVHILPDAQTGEILDLSKPLTTTNAGEITPDTISCSSSVTSGSTPSQGNDSKHMDEFIHSHYDFLEYQDTSSHTQNSSSHNRDSSSHNRDSSSHQQDSSSQGAVYSDESVAKESVISSTKPSVRFSDITLEAKETYPGGSNGQVALHETNTNHHPTSLPTNENSSTNNRSLTRIDVPIPDYDEQPSDNQTVKPINHIDEIKQRFSVHAKAGLKTTPTSVSNTTSPETSQPLPVMRKPQSNKLSRIPNDPVEELKMRISTGNLKPLTSTKRDITRPPSSTSLFSRKNRHSNDKLSTDTQLPSNTSAYSRRLVHSNTSSAQVEEDDIYLRPIRSSATIQLTS